MTLRQLAASILGPDAEVGCVRVEAVAKLGGEVTTFNEADLEYVHNVVRSGFGHSNAWLVVDEVQIR